MIVIPSLGRPGNVPKMEPFLNGEQPFWLVTKEQEWSYRKAGAKFFLHQPGTGVAAARNVALDALDDEWLIMVDDDLKALRYAGGGTLTLADFSKWSRRAHDATGAYLTGTSKVTNEQWARRKITLCGAIHSKLMGIHSRAAGELRFDEGLAESEDYDFTAQAIARYGQVARLDWIIAKARMKSPGGLLDVMSAEERIERGEEATRVLCQRWPTMIRPGPDGKPYWYNVRSL